MMNTCNQLGQNWILLTGLSRESAHWGDFIQHLQAAFPDSRIMPLDLPGTGRLYREPSPDTMLGITECVRNFARQQGVMGQPATLLALSLGAMVAWEWLLKYPDEICGAALVGASFSGLSPWYQRLRWQSYGKIAELGLRKTVHGRELAILQLISNVRDRDSQIMAEWQKIQNQRPVGFKNIYRQILAAAGYCPSTEQPVRPVLLLNSKGDRLVSPACSEAISDKWHLELRTHSWAGHDLPLDDGLWVIERLKEWLDRH